MRGKFDQVLDAANGEQALEVMRHGRPDLMWTARFLPLRPGAGATLCAPGGRWSL